MALYNKALGVLIDNLQAKSLWDSDPSSRLSKLAWKLCSKSEKVYKLEDERMEAVGPVINDLFLGFRRREKRTLIGEIISDSVIFPSTWTDSSARPTLLIEVWKVETDLGGNAEAQAVACYSKLVSQDNVSESKLTL